MTCRLCNTRLAHVFIDLGHAPPSNAFLRPEQLSEPEVYYPLKLLVCHECFLVQVDEHKKADEIFGGTYAYFSSFSRSWLAHARAYRDMAIERFGLDARSLVIEVASNDGYLLQYFLESGIPCLGIEPAANTAAACREKSIEVITEFFGAVLAERLRGEGRRADLLIGNNVLAHVPDLSDFVRGLRILLSDRGVITVEFPHVMRLVEGNQFDTIYHEHFSYLSLTIVVRAFAAHGLTVFDVEELPTHGGSLRVYARRDEAASLPVAERVGRLLDIEREHGLTGIGYYAGFQTKADAVKCGLVEFLIRQKRKGKRVVAYGAAAKGNTLLNYCGVRADLIEYVVDASPHKQGTFLPGSHIPVVAEARLRDTRPDFIVVLPWNIRDEITAQLAYARDWGAQFVVAVPALEVV